MEVSECDIIRDKFSLVHGKRGMSLFDTISAIADDVEKQISLMTGEEATLQVSIRPFIEDVLGYNFRNLAEVVPQFTADAKSTGGESVDYAIMRDDKPVVFIEAKSASVKLNETHWKQLHNYFNAKDVRFGILTNGLEYRFYTDLKKSNIMDKQPFLTINMLDLDKESVSALNNFTKAHWDTNEILAYAQRQRIKQLLEQEMEKPSDALVEYFAKPLHYGRMTANDKQQYRNLLRDAWRELVDIEVPKRSHRLDEDDEMAKTTIFNPSVISEPISTSPLLGNEAVTRKSISEMRSNEGVWIPIYAQYEGEDFEVKFQVKHTYKKRNDKIVLYKGKTYTLSKLAKQHKTRIHKEKNINKNPNTNGWKDFWYYEDSNGVKKPLDDFRNNPELVERYLRNKKQ